MDSTWEKDMSEWMDDRDIIWERSRKKHVLWWIDKKGRKRRYYPDFYLPKLDLYIDTKNPYLIKKDKEKLDYIQKECKVHLIVGDLELIKGYLCV